MTKKEHIDYWIRTSDDDWKRVNILFKNKEYVFSLFCTHLSVEKICKAIWVKDNVSNFPPKIHDLVRIIEGTKLELSMVDKQFLKRLTEFQLEGRYPDYQFNLQKICNKTLTSEIIKQSKALRIKLRKEKLYEL